MNEMIKSDQIERVLQMYAKLSDGYVVNKAEEAVRYGVNEKSIQRDIEHIRNFLDNDSERTGLVNTIVYDRAAKGYRLETLYQIRLQNPEVLALCKILLDSRAFTKDEMVSMLDKLITCCVPKVNQKRVKELISNEEFHYVEPRHKTKFINLMWDLGQAIREARYIEMFTNGNVIDGHWKDITEIPTESDVSRRMSADMKKRGICYAGPVITYSFLQAIGIVNDHLEGCRYR